MENDKQELGQSQSIEMFTTFAREYIFKKTEKNHGNFITSCWICKEWYHKKCMNIPLKVFFSENVVDGIADPANRNIYDLIIAFP